MKTQHLFLMLSFFATIAVGQSPPPANPAPPPAAPAKRSAADLEKLVAPIALYPDSLIATILPASVYPLEIVQAARFVSDTNNLAKLDEQPWDDNVKAVARVPQVIKQLNDDLSWTMELGEAFLAQDKDVMDAMQSMRAKAQQVGTLKTTPQQIVVVTNVIVEKTVEQKVVVVTNTIVQIQPASSTVVYVPTYNPTVVYYPPPPAYVGPPPIVTFAAGVAVGAIIANNVDWHHGGCYHGDVNIDIDRNVNVNNNVNRTANVNNNVNNNVNRNANVNNNANRNANVNNSGGQQKWQPDQSRLSKSGTPSTSAASKQARGWDSGGAGRSSGGAGARPSTGTASASRAAPSASASRPSASPSASQSKASPSASRGSSSGSAFSGASGGSPASSASNRGRSSRSSGGGGRSFGRR